MSKSVSTVSTVTVIKVKLWDKYLTESKCEIFKDSSMYEEQYKEYEQYEQIEHLKQSLQPLQSLQSLQSLQPVED